MTVRGLKLRLRRLRARVRASLLLRVAACVAIAAATVIGCGWPGTSRSVRFDGYQTEQQMSRLPPLPTLANGKTDAQRYWGYEDEEGEDAESIASQKHAAEIDALWEKAEAAEENGDLPLARNLLRDYLTRTSVGRDALYGPEARQARRNSAIDRLDAMTALDRGARVSAVQSYLAARHAYDNRGAPDDETDTDKSKSGADKSKAGADEKRSGDDETKAGPDQSISDALAAVSPDESLRDNVAYLRAALSYQREDYTDAAAAFTKLARQFPQSEKCEAALYMAALSTMKMSETFTGTSGDEAHLQAGSRRYSSDSSTTTREDSEPTPVAECCDEEWREARAGFTRVLRLYPDGRYSADARGWLAYLLLRANDRAGALVEYYRLLGDQQNLNTRLEAAFSLTLVRHHASDDEMRRVEAELEDEPAAALAYAYHNIYNYAIDPGCQLLNDYPDNEYEADLQTKEKESLQHAELQRIVAFASRLMKRYPQANISGGFAVRLAGASLELAENQQAAQQAERALSLNVRGEERARALWIKGVAEERLHKFAEARRTLSTLIIENPQGQFTEGARRLLAMVAEDAGDVGAALEQYLILKYDPDVAYFIDVLMTPEQLAAFIESHKDSEKLDELIYALGVRYMRARRWDEARSAFKRVRTRGENGDNYYYSPYDSNNTCYSPPGFEYRCKDPKDTDDGPGVTARLLMRDLRTIDDLQGLEHAADIAQGAEAQAEALYQLASYLFESSTLLFYNPIAWHSMRHYQLNDLQSMNRYRVAGEAEVVWRDMQEHEPIARALVIYLEVVRRFPQTRAARDALYTAAVCHERLSNYNEYWREIYRTGLHAGDRMVTYPDVRATYPDYQLPRGTYYWEPVTRTFHGGPGWASPPKPQPRPTRRERLTRLCEKLWDWLGVFWAEKARRWVLIGLMLPGALFASYFAAQSRRLLRRQIGQRRIRRRPLRRWLAAYRAGQLKYHASDEAHALARRIAHQGVRLVLNPRGRLLIGLNLLAHGLLLALLIAVVETLHPG
ncbi:MAG TPA: outer membrane protein assembly factor BamD [Pyrinomonadaceae bacterium]